MPDYSRYQCIKVEKENKLATVTLNRPDSLNAVNGELHHELSRIWVDIAEDEEINAVVLTGAGRAFCAGGDVKGMSRRAGDGGAGAPASARPAMLTTPAEARRIVQNMLDVEQPIIGAINGDAVGLGATIALLCDIIVASEKARFADTHVTVGVVAGDGGALIWPLLIGPARAKEFLMRSNFITGAEAGRIGMVNYAVAPEQVMPKARELAQIPVIGPLEAAVLLARPFGHRFSVLTDHRKAVPEIEDRVRLYGVEANCRSVRAIDWFVDDMIGDPESVAGGGSGLWSSACIARPAGGQ